MLKVGSEAGPSHFFATSVSLILLEFVMCLVRLGSWGELHPFWCPSAGSRCGAQAPFAFPGVSESVQMKSTVPFEMTEEHCTQIPGNAQILIVPATM